MNDPWQNYEAQSFNKPKPIVPESPVYGEGLMFLLVLMYLKFRRKNNE